MALASPKENHRTELLGKSLTCLLGIRSGNLAPHFLTVQVLVYLISNITPHFCVTHFLCCVTQTPIWKQHIVEDVTACSESRKLQHALGSSCFQPPSDSYLAPPHLCMPWHPPPGANTSHRAESLLLEEQKEIFELFTLQLTPVPQIKMVRTASPKVFP